MVSVTPIEHAATIQQTVEAFRLRMHHATSAGDHGAFMSSFAELQRWIADRHDDAGIEELEASGYLAQHFESFAHYQRRCLKEQEMAESEMLLRRPRSMSGLEALLDSTFARQTYRRVAEALTLADFNRCRRFVMVGCGPFPAAALFIHDHTPTPEIVAIDKDRDAIAMASRVVAAFTHDRIRISPDDGVGVDYGNADIVYVANHVTPKAQVVQRVLDTVAADAQVIVREPWGYGRLFAEPGVAHLDPRAIVCAVGEAHRHFLSRHVRLAHRTR
jgi:hypothetical protein